MAAPMGERIKAVEERQASDRGELRDFKREMRTELAGIHSDVRAIRDALLQGKGGWKVAMALFSLGVAILAAVVTQWAVSLFGPGK